MSKLEYDSKGDYVHVKQLCRISLGPVNATLQPVCLEDQTVLLRIQTLRQLAPPRFRHPRLTTSSSTLA